MMSLSIIYLLLIIFSDSFLCDGLSSFYCTFCNAFFFIVPLVAVGIFDAAVICCCKVFCSAASKQKKRNFVRYCVLFSLAQKHQKQYNFLTWVGGGGSSVVLFFSHRSMYFFTASSFPIRSGN